MIRPSKPTGRRPSPALVISVIALIVAVGGGTFAFAALNKKTVNKIANRDANNVFGSRIGSASVANATNATNLAAPEPVHPIGATGEPQFLNGAANFTPTTTPAGFYKDRQCVVHLQGTITATSDTNDLQAAGR